MGISFHPRLDLTAVDCMSSLMLNNVVHNPQVYVSVLGTCESVFFCSNLISNRIGRPIRFRIESSNRIGHIPCKP